MKRFFLSLAAIALVSTGARAAEPPPFPAPGAHPPMRAEVESGYHFDRGPFVGLGYRFGLHDFLDLAKEYPESTLLELFALRLRYLTKTSEFWLERLTLVRVTSLSPYDPVDPELSYEIDLGTRTVRERACNGCNAAYLKGSLGITFRASSKLPIEAFVLADFESSFAPRYERSSVKPAAGPRAGLKMRFSNGLAAWVSGAYRYQLFATYPHVYEITGEARWALSPSIAINARVQRFVDGWESAGAAYFYF